MSHVSRLALRRNGRSASRAACAVAAAILTACVAPARSYGSYEGKAGATADNMHSAVETARFAVQNAAANTAPAPYVAVVLTDAEDDASAIQGAFDSIQPPDERSEDLKTVLDDILSDVVDHLADVRIATRRGQLHDLAVVATPLATDARKLRKFEEAATA